MVAVDPKQVAILSSLACYGSYFGSWGFYHETLPSDQIFQTCVIPAEVTGGWQLKGAEGEAHPLLGHPFKLIDKSKWPMS